ncbi:hypothetical protein SAMN06297129_3505 [Pseudooceanicola antarcticus]|uniref:Uncharacterized protein n=1 Tax=Pseudooceanicola antarcticus TaxID=1247613 RepID=A0A285JD93_9RHOB|nr:hypothetical protein [Pseudooceanicola antarcticus]PJE31379.1 hypothetical protein CVM39_04000 [Pseudooceanicola antarcticus]SNY58063.1 hypothetical protein SAMN06297129_3505 [Pseudooceanicola antarcticus]
MNAITTEELHRKLADVSDLISGTRPGNRHRHLPQLHALVGDFARKGVGVPPRLRQLQEDLTNEAIESRFDNLPI